MNREKLKEIQEIVSKVGSVSFLAIVDLIDALLDDPPQPDVDPVAYRMREMYAQDGPPAEKVEGESNWDAVERMVDALETPFGVSMSKSRARAIVVQYLPSIRQAVCSEIEAELQHYERQLWSHGEMTRYSHGGLAACKEAIAIVRRIKGPTQ